MATMNDTARIVVLFVNVFIMGWNTACLIYYVDHPKHRCLAWFALGCSILAVALLSAVIRWP
jgi:hypothetical protein